MVLGTRLTGITHGCGFYSHSSILFPFLFPKHRQQLYLFDLLPIVISMENIERALLDSDGAPTRGDLNDTSVRWLTVSSMDDILQYHHSTPGGCFIPSRGGPGK